MFGKPKKSSSDRFVINQGMKNGNLTPPWKKSTAPMKEAPVRGDSDKRSVKVMNNTKPSLGAALTFQTKGKGR